ncbi:protein kinase [Magnetospirillum sp. 15-1]|uniref:serine/threonine protein kinase n=1 Tax=Magnetospirillum sp. 15-1 TaxID=1979370 RepID=UPI000BBBE25E|nr:protein kinase [Magnetospirillum sp. 15-1]
MSGPHDITCRLLVNEQLTPEILLGEFLGGGSFGGVFRYDSVVGDRKGAGRRAVKVIFPDPNPRIARDQMNELLVLPDLDNDHIVRAFHCGQVDVRKINASILYMTMELADLDPNGRPITLRTKIDALTGAAALSPSRLSLARDVGMAMTCALEYFATQSDRLIHRDIKPENVLKVKGAWKLADFGLVRALGEDAYRRSSQAMGTYLYMPPEAYDGKQSQAWDVWSLAVMLSEILTGRMPFDGSQTEVMRKVLSAAPDFGGVKLPEPFHRLIRGGLERDARRRWTARQIKEALDAPPRPESHSVPNPSPRAVEAPFVLQGGVTVAARRSAGPGFGNKRPSDADIANDPRVIEIRRGNEARNEALRRSTEDTIRIMNHLRDVADVIKNNPNDLGGLGRAYARHRAPAPVEQFPAPPSNVEQTAYQRAKPPSRARGQKEGGRKISLMISMGFAVLCAGYLLIPITKYEAAVSLYVCAGFDQYRVPPYGLWGKYALRMEDVRSDGFIRPSCLEYRGVADKITW